MSKHTTEAIIDGVLKTLVATAGLSAAVIAPNVLQALHKPYGKFLKTMDNRQQEREIHRVIYYMRQQKLISGSYEHGLEVTKKGQQRYTTKITDDIKIPRQNKWDHKWRIVFYDIPEPQRNGRNALSSKLRELGFYRLQRSVMVHPFPCREQITQICEAHGISKYVSYIETNHIDQNRLLVNKFKKIL